MSSSTEEPTNTGRRPSNVPIAIAIVIAGGLIAGAIVFASQDSNEGDGPRTETVTSAQRAWEFITAGWTCVLERPSGEVIPLVADSLEPMAEAENAGEIEAFFAETPVTCTAPG